MAQPTKQWDQTLGGDSKEYLHSGQQTSDGGFILGGTSYSGASGDKTQYGYSPGLSDFWVVKLNGAGVKEWDKTIGGNSHESLQSIQQTADGGFILGGYSWSNISGDKSENAINNEDYWVVKLNAAGQKEWDKTFGGSMQDRLYAIQQTTDGGYILGGFSNSNASGNKSENARGYGDYWVLKLNASGNKEWDKTIGGNDREEFKTIRQTPDGGFIIGGDSESNAGGDKSENKKGFSDYWVVKLNAAGAKEWDKTFGGYGSQGVTSIQLTADGGYILGGKSNSNTSGDKSENSRGGTDYWLVKLNASGSKEWDKTLGGNSEDELSFVQQTADGGYFMGGTSTSNISGDKSENRIGPGDNTVGDYWVVKLFASTTSARAIQTLPLNAPGYCAGFDEKVTVPFTTTGTFSANEIFIAQLSDDAGSFANPVNLGTGTTSPIETTIPVDTRPGNGYRIRVISSITPAVIGSDNGTNLGISSQALGQLQIDGPLSPCESSTVTYSIWPVDGFTNFSWAVPTGWTILNGQGTTSITVSVGRQGTISIRGENFCGSNNGYYNVTPVALPAEPEEITASSSTVCVGDTVVYSTSTPYVASPYNRDLFHWTVPKDWIILNEKEITSITVLAGTAAGEIGLTILNKCGSSARRTLAVSSSGPPIPTVISQTICGPGAVTLTASGAPATGSYRWYTSSSGGTPITGVTGTTFITPLLNATTTYYASIVNGTCESARVPVTATINPVPDVVATASASTITAGGSTTLSATGANSYVWSPATGLSSSTSATVTATPAVTTTYMVTGTGANGCSSTASVTITVTTPPVTTGFPIAKNSVWKYHDKGVDLGTAWTAPGYDDTNWSSGTAVLGYGDPVATTLGYGPNSSSKYPTYYFRKSFEVADASLYSTLVFNIRRDDGAVVYLNGVELFRTNMPAGAVSYTTWAAASVGGSDEATYYSFRVPASQLRNGNNVLAVSVHQDNAVSSDINFDMEVKGEAVINQSPSVNITSPVSGASFTAPATIAIAANASDADGTVSKVEFFSGTTKLGEDLTAPYTYNWTGVAAGTFALTTKATDNAGAITTSASVTITVTAPPVTASFPIPKNSVWKYHDKGLDLGTAWTAPAYDDATWSSGAGVLGYGDPVATTLGYGPNSSNKYPTYYFRKSFEVADASLYSTLVFNIRRDDGAVVYLNGVELFRTNMPAGAIGYSTFASSALSGADETTYFTFKVPATLLKNGRNVIAVSLHQDNGGSSDITFDMEVSGETATNQPPGVSIISPTTSASYTAPATINITANATDADGSVAKVEFFAGAIKLGEDLTAPYSFTWSNVAAGSYSLTAKATDNLGATASSATISISVNATPPAGGFPVVKNSVWKYHDKGIDLGTVWTAPGYDDTGWSSGTAVLGYGDPVTTTLNFGGNSSSKYPTYYFRKSFEVADASLYSTLVFNIRRDDGAVVYLNGVELFRTNMPAGAVSYTTWAAAPVGGSDEATYYSFRVPASQLRNGRNVLAVSVHQDNAVSSDINFDMEVEGETGTNIPPTVSIISPTTSASYTAPATVNITANAADADGSVSKVEFFNGATRLGEDLSSPYTFTWSNVSAETYVITAKAIDNAGAITTSASVTITVNTTPPVTAGFPIAKNSVWKYHDKGLNLGTAWTALNYDDAAWSSGAAVLGYGDPVATTLGYGTNSSSKYTTYYFRKSFEVADASLYSTLVFNIRRDDGAVVYLNGVELFRTNMPAGAVSYTTWAAASVGGSDETTYYSFRVPASQLRNGNNVLAVSVHQDKSVSSDINFDMEVKGETFTSPSFAPSNLSLVNQENYVGTRKFFRTNPNPFLDKTTVEFSFDQNEEYKVMIYDVRGSLVKFLKSGKAKANTLVQVEWGDEKTPAGVYLLRLVTKGGVQTLRVVRE